MATPRGYFDPELVPKSWFDPSSATQLGQFDKTLDDATSGVAAAVGAAPGIATFSSAPGRATADSGVRSLGPPWWQFIPQREQRRQDATVPAERGVVRSISAPGGARGGVKQPPVARLPERKRRLPKAARASARPAALRMACAPGGARGGAAGLSGPVWMRAASARGGARAGASMAAVPGEVQAACAVSGARGYHGPTDEQLAAVLLSLDA